MESDVLGHDVLIVNNRQDEIGRLTQWLESYGARQGLAAERLFKLTLVLDEWVTNVVRYGYDDHRTDHEIKIELRHEPARVTARISDDGRPFDPLAHDSDPPDTDSVEDRVPGGLGIHFLKTFMQDLRYERRQGHNLLTMSLGLVD